MNPESMNLKTPLAPRRTSNNRAGNVAGSNTDAESVRFKGDIIQGYFLLVNPDGSNSIIPLTNGEIKIGRRIDNDIVIKHNYISRVHSTCRIKDGVCHMKSLSSTNFTQINSTRMKRGQYYEVNPCFDVVNMMGFVFRWFRTPIQLTSSLNRSPRRKTGIYLDIRVCLHSNPLDPNHPESPNRIFQIESMLERNPQYMNRCVRLSKRMATDDELALCHTRSYIKKVKLMKITSGLGGNIFMNQYTPQAAYLSAGGVINLVEKVCTGELENGFAFIRPPGHHASRSKAMGFCFFNNVAVAARVASRKFQKRVIIVDWDVHHGNGTNKILEEDPNIVYFSTHRYGAFYPGTGHIDDIGKKKGRGFNINIPFTFGYNNQDELYSFFQILLPICFEFSPDIIIVSAGFDAVMDDPLGGCYLSPEIYGVMTSLLKSVTKNVVLALEGGYNVHQTARCCLECLKVLVGENPSRIPLSHMEERNRQTDVLIRQSKTNLNNHWKSIRPEERKEEVENNRRQHLNPSLQKYFQPPLNRGQFKPQELARRQAIVHGPPANHAAAFFMSIPPIPRLGEKPPPPPTPPTPGGGGQERRRRKRKRASARNTKSTYATKNMNRVNFRLPPFRSLMMKKGQGLDTTKNVNQRLEALKKVVGLPPPPPPPPPPPVSSLNKTLTSLLSKPSQEKKPKFGFKVPLPPTRTTGLKTLKLRRPTFIYDPKGGKGKAGIPDIPLTLPILGLGKGIVAGGIVPPPPPPPSTWSPHNPPKPSTWSPHNPKPSTQQQQTKKKEESSSDSSSTRNRPTARTFESLFSDEDGDGGESKNKTNFSSDLRKVLKKRKRVVAPSELFTRRKKRKLQSQLQSGKFMKTITPHKILNNNNNNPLPVPKVNKMEMEVVRVISTRSKGKSRLDDLREKE